MRKILAAAIAFIALSVQNADAQDSYVLLGGELLDGTGTPPAPNSAILVQGSRIALVGIREFSSDNGKLVSKIRTPKGVFDIPDSAGVYDVSGKFILPGLIDAHIHYDGTKRGLLSALAWGVTSANCMVEATGAAIDLERRTAPDSAAAPQMYATAPIFSVKEGWSSWDNDFPNDPALNRFPATPNEARAQVRIAKAKGVKRIKIAYDDMRWCRDPLPPLVRMKKNVMAALIDEAGRLGLMTEVHAPQLKDAWDVLRTAPAAAAGGSGKKKPNVPARTPPPGGAGHIALANGVVDDTLDARFRQTMLARGAYYVPTFSLFQFLGDPRQFMRYVLQDPRVQNALPESLSNLYGSEGYFTGCKERYPNSRFVVTHMPVLQRNAKLLLDSRVPIVMGTAMPGFPGVSAHLELEYMVQAGLSPLEAIMAATKTAARFLGRDSTLGTIEAGKQADMVILSSSPMQFIQNTRSVWKIVKQGMIYDHGELIRRSLKER